MEYLYQQVLIKLGDQTQQGQIWDFSKGRGGEAVAWILGCRIVGTCPQNFAICFFCFFFHIFIHTAKVVTNTVHNSTYIHLLAMRHVTEFTFIAWMQMLDVTLLTYNTLCYLLVNITQMTLTANITLHYITRYYITIHYNCTLLAYTVHRLQYMT